MLSLMHTRSDLGAAISRHFDDTFRRIQDNRTARTDSYFRMITGEAHPLGNLAVIRPEAGVEEVRECVEPLCTKGLPSAAVFHAAVPPELEACLSELGFEAHGAMPAMAVEIDRLASTGLPDGYRFARVGTEANDPWVQAFAVGYELPQGMADLFSPAAMDFDPADDAELQWFAVYKGAEIVSVSVLVLSSGLAGVYCVATVPDERGKGLGAHLTSEPLRIARRLGFTTGVLQSSDMGYGVYQRLGFEKRGDGLPIFVRMPA